MSYSSGPPLPDDRERVPMAKQDTSAEEKPSPNLAPRVAPLPSWVTTAISGVTLASVLGGVFAAGMWKGSIDTQLQLAAERQKQMLDEQKETRQKVEDLKAAVAELKGQLGHSPSNKGGERGGE